MKIESLEREVRRLKTLDDKARRIVAGLKTETQQLRAAWQGGGERSRVDRL